MNKQYADKIDAFHSAITEDEKSRVFSGLLTEDDFSTSSPNKFRISRISSGIQDYLRYKSGVRRRQAVDIY